MRISDWSSDVCSSDLDWHLRQFHRIAGLHVYFLASNDLIADSQSLRCQNIVLLTIFILHQGDKCGAVGIVLDALYGRFNVPFAPLEIDEAVTLLVATRYTARCHMAFVITAPGLLLTQIGRATCRE